MWRKVTDYNHINVAELETVLKGVNIAIKWGMKSLNLKTDSSTIYRWLAMDIGEMIVKRRLSILVGFIKEFVLRVSVDLIPTSKNKTDALTRVCKK